MSARGEQVAICLIAQDGSVRYRDAAIERLFGMPIEVGERLASQVPWLSRLTPEEPGTFAAEDGITVTITPLGLTDVAALVRVTAPSSQGDLEQELRLARHTLTSILDAAPISILVLDMHKKVTMWNAAATRMFGWTPEEILGRDYPLVPEGEWRFFEKLFARVTGGEGFTGVEASRARKDGSSIDLRIHTAPMRDAQGQVTGAMAILEDLSEQRRLEARVQHSEKMEAVGRLAGGIAHDFNNLLTVILGTGEVLLARDVLSPRVSRGLQEITECGERARGLTAQLLAFSRRQVLHPEVVDMNDQVTSTVRLLSRLIGEQIEMRLELCPEALPVKVDRGQFDQVLVNLAVNARDAMKDGGTLFVMTRLDPDGAGDLSIEPGRHAVLVIRDTGQGISKEVLPHIFDPFFTTKGPGRGTGLGLATVHGVIEQSGGSIDVQSLERKGVTFTVRLPLLSAASDAQFRDPGDDAASELPRGDEAILLVEDDPSVRRIASAMLRRLGYRVSTADDGRDALARLADGAEVQAVITDVAMPRMGGRLLSTELQTVRPELPIIFVSANLDDETLRELIDADGARFLQKPFGLAELAHCLRQVLDA